MSGNTEIYRSGIPTCFEVIKMNTPEFPSRLKDNDEGYRIPALSQNYIR